MVMIVLKVVLALLLTLVPFVFHYVIKLPEVEKFL